MNCFQESDICIAETLFIGLTDVEKEAILVEKGSTISSTNKHVGSVLAKMMKLKPIGRSVINVSSQEYIMFVTKKYVFETSSDCGTTSSVHKNIIEYVKNNAQKKIEPEDTASKSDVYGDALFNELTSIGYDGMDENNKRIADIGKNEGVKSAVSETVKNSGGDYARMRMMYG